MLDLNQDRLRDMADHFKAELPYCPQCEEVRALLLALADALTPSTLPVALAACVQAAGLPEVGAKVKWQKTRATVLTYRIRAEGLTVLLRLNSGALIYVHAEDAAALEVVPGE